MNWARLVSRTAQLFYPLHSALILAHGISCFSLRSKLELDASTLQSYLKANLDLLFKKKRVLYIYFDLNAKN